MLEQPYSKKILTKKVKLLLRSPKNYDLKNSITVSINENCRLFMEKFSNPT